MGSGEKRRHIWDNGGLTKNTDDGTLRLYELPAPKVVRAIKSLGSEIASIATLRSKDPQAGGLWIASGCRVRRELMVL